MVQLRQATDTPPPFHRAPGPGPLDQEAVEEGWQGLWSRAPPAWWLWEERATGAVLEFLEDTRVGCRTSARVIRLREEGDQEPEGEEGGPGPP